MSLTCALSGESLMSSGGDSEAAAVVMTPSGYICLKRLLLSKLAENGGVDPFEKTPSRTVTLAEEDLVIVQMPMSSTGKAMVPPRPSQSSSLPSLLGMMQKEYDSLTLELFDTRKALEDTRRELSQALYQNDAAVRVVARLSIERDQAREELKNWNAQVPPTAATETVTETKAETEAVANPKSGQEEPHSKRRRVQSKDTVVDNDGDEDNGDKGPLKNSIPQDHLTVMVDTWKDLSKGRKQKGKATATPADQLSKYEQLRTKSLHKSRSKAGILQLVSRGDFLYTAGHDKQIVKYDATKQTVEFTISKLSSHVSSLSVNDTFIAAGFDNGWIRIYSANDNGAIMGAGLNLKRGKVVGLTLHPSGTHILCATHQGTVVLCSIDKNDGALSELSYFESDHTTTANTDTASTIYTCGALHPDGLIYGAGTQGGDVHIWDLKNQNLAGNLKGKNYSIASLDFSNNGYHIATALSDIAEVQLWDLRKLKVLRTLNSASGNDDDDDDLLQSTKFVTFDESGKHLAFGGEGGARITTAKEWGVTAKLASGQDVSGITWGNNSIATCSAKERPLRFHGPPVK